MNTNQKKQPNLPSREKVDISKLFGRKPSKKLNEGIEKLKSDIDSTLEQKLFQWENASSWDFELPETVFTGEEAPVQFYKQNQEIGTYSLTKLTEQQLKTIKQKGEFMIKSDLEQDTGTTWKMNPWIVKGKEDIQKTFLNTLAFSWDQILQIPRRLGPKHSKEQTFIKTLVSPNLINGLRSVVSLADKVANLTFGTKKVQIYTDEEILQELQKEYYEETVIKYYENMTKAFFKFVSDQDAVYQGNNSSFKAENQEFKQKQEKQRHGFNVFNEKFTDRALELEKEKISQLEKGDINENQALFQILEEKQKLLFIMMGEHNQPENIEVRKHLIDLIRATQITVRYYEKLQTKISQEKTQIEEEICSNHPVKSLVEEWLSKKTKERMKPKIKELVQVCNSQIIQELKEQGLKAQIILLERFAEFQFNKKQLLKKNRSRIQQQNIIPCRVFQTEQHILGERKVIINTDSRGRVVYSEEKSKIYKTPTSFFGWRLVLQLVRWKAWTVNTFGYLTDNLIDGPLGLKALFYSHPFPAGYYIDENTGKKHSSSRKITPYLEILRKIGRGITRSREEFESLPDRGIFGKRFSRIFNLVECYFFRGLVAGTAVGVGMPLLALANCILSAFLAITSWLWIPVSLVLRWIYHILFWDFDSPTRQGWCDYNRLYMGYQTFELFPLIRAIVQAAFGVAETASSLANATIIHPAMALLGVLTAYGRMAISSGSDSIMCAITGEIGRQPEIDSKIAWKIRGTGVTQQYVDSMQIDDVKFLVRSWLERQELEECFQSLKDSIEEPYRIYSQQTEELFGQYGYSTQYNSYLRQNVESLKNQLQVQYENRVKILPVLRSCNVKFTDEEMGQLMPACESIIQSFVTVHDMEKVIFKDKSKHPQDDLWVYCLNPQEYQENTKKPFYLFVFKDVDYKKITENVLVDIFHDENILFPFSELDKRIEIQTVKQPKYDSIKRAIDGETHLKDLVPSIEPRYRKFTKTQLCRFVDAKEIERNTRKMNQYCIKNGGIGDDPSSNCFFLPFEDFKKVENTKAQNQKSD